MTPRTSKKSPPVAYAQGGTHCYSGFASDSCRAVAKDFQRRGYIVRTFEPENLPKNVGYDTPVKGKTTAVAAIYERLFPGTTFPNIDVPKPLRAFARRKLTYTTLGALREKERKNPGNIKPLFVKPCRCAKEFPSGFAVNVLPNLWHQEDDLPVLVQTARSFSLETRFFVGPRGLRTRINPYPKESQFNRLENFALELTRLWTDAPAAYILDVAFSSRRWGGIFIPTLVEVNSALTAGGFETVKNPSTLVETAWKSYARYAETGNFR